MNNILQVLNFGVVLSFERNTPENKIEFVSINIVKSILANEISKT